MSRHNPYPDEKDMMVRVMVGDPLALAWQWIVQYTKNVNSNLAIDEERITVDDMIDVAMVSIDGGWEYISRPSLESNRTVDPTFWEKLAILKEIDIPQDSRGSFFTCSC